MYLLNKGKYKGDGSWILIIDEEKSCDCSSFPNATLVKNLCQQSLPIFYK